MPHSPRWHDGSLWLLNSGRGELWKVDPVTWKHDVVCVLPAYLRGLHFVGHYALIGMSLIREQHLFSGLPVQERFKELKCGVAVVDLRTGKSLGALEFTAGCREVFDVSWLPDVRRPMLLNPEHPASRSSFDSNLQRLAPAAGIAEGKTVNRALGMEKKRWENP